MPALSMSRAPATSAPLRFLLTAPWFLIAAGGVLVWAGPDPLASRWSPSILAVTHLLTLGFMAQAMLGALLQLLPVMAALPVPGTLPMAALVHPGLSAGALALVGGFLFLRPVFFQVAVVLLALAFGAYLVVVLAACVRNWPRRHDAARGIVIALVGLALTVLLGLLLASAFGWGASWPLIDMTNAHAAWGLVGWTGVLVLGVSLAVVPMFQMTSNYPAFLARWLAPATFLALATWSLAMPLGKPALHTATAWGAAACMAVFGIATLVLQRKSRRRHPDATARFWRLGMICLVAASLAWGAGRILGFAGTPSHALLLGVLMIPGFAVCVICGMLYKIVPFLLWIDLSQTMSGRLPSVKQILPDTQGALQFRVHVAALAMLCLAGGMWAWLVYPAGVLLALSGALLTVSVTRAWLFARRIKAASKPIVVTERTRSRWKRLD